MAFSSFKTSGKVRFSLVPLHSAYYGGVARLFAANESRSRPYNAHTGVLRAAHGDNEADVNRTTRLLGTVVDAEGRPVTDCTVVIFAADAWDNIRYGRPGATDAEVRAAAEAAAAAEFLDHLPEGFSTQLGERGVGATLGHKRFRLFLGLDHHAARLS